MTTIAEAIAALEHVKKTLAEERAQWKKTEAYLLEELAAEKKKSKKAPVVIEQTEGDPPEAVRDETFRRVLAEIDEIQSEASRKRMRWDSLDKEDRRKAPQLLRQWAHPFFDVAVQAVRDKIEEMRKEGKS